MKPNVTVFIRVRNEAAALARTLAALGAQSRKADGVVVLDNASTDGTVQVAAAAGAAVHTIDAGSFTYGRSLNRAMELCDGDIIVFLSAHCRPLSDDWLGALVGPLDRGEAEATYGRQVPVRGVNPFEAWETRRTFPRRPRAVLRALGLQSPHFSNAAAAVAAATLRVHRFDETLSFAEDVAWEQVVRRAGVRVAYVPEAAVEHSHALTPAAIERRMELVGRAMAQRGYCGPMRYAAARAAAAAACTAVDWGYCLATGQAAWMGRAWAYRRAQVRGMGAGLSK